MNVLPVQKFNDDLLLTESDRDLALRSFPELFHILDFPELRDVFRKYDVPANRAKRNRRSAGVVAILLGVLALLGASAAPVYEGYQSPWPKVFGGISALLGVCSILLGTIGTLSGKSKYKWLCNRLMTERLRQFHFQLIGCRMPEILTSIGSDPAREQFLSNRRSWFAAYQMAYADHLPARLKIVLDDDAEDDFLLHHDPERWQPPETSDANLDRIFSAYRLLRFEHQIQYTNYKLGKDGGPFFSSPVRQLALLRNLSFMFMIVVFLAHLGIAFSFVPGWDWPTTSVYVHLGIIWVVIGILAVRIFEEGLQSAREVERYTRYRSSLMSLLNRFDNATIAKDKIRIMREVERASYEEMRGFLKINYEAGYVL